MDDDRIDESLRARMPKLGATPDVAPALDGFRAMRTRRRRRRRVGIAIASIVVVVVGAVGLRAAVDAGDEDSSGVVTDPGDPTAPPISTTPPATTLAPGTTVLMPEVVGFEYRDAIAALERVGLPGAGGHIRLALEASVFAAHGTVLNLNPAPRIPTEVGTDVTIYVAASDAELGLPDASTYPDPPYIVSSIEAFPPSGLRVGVVAGTTAPECATTVNGTAGLAVRFLHGELVGCFYNRFVWLDDLPAALREVTTMPDVVGLTLDEANALLATTAPAVTPRSPIHVVNQPNAVVIGSFPAPGAPITRADGVEFEVGELQTRDATEVHAFFFAQNSECVSRLPASRDVPAGRDAIEVAFEQQFAGPTAAEQTLGAYWWSADSSVLRSVTLQDGLLTIDVDDIQSWIAGNYNTACGSRAINSGLLATAFQFRDVDRVQLTAEGSCQAAAVFENEGCEISTRADWLANR